MRVETLGEGHPEVAIVAGIHGDEPCGVQAVERLIEERPEVRRPVKLIVANEPAVERGVRYIDADLNRSFPGDPKAEAYERRLAAEITQELAGCRTLALHSTRSHAEPFAVVDEFDEFGRFVCPRLPVVAAVETGDFVGGRLFAAAETVEVECGLQGTERAVENAYDISRAFLTAVNALPGDAVARELPAYRLDRTITKEPAEEYEVFVENFQRVETGTTFAAADGDALIADEDFYPVLLSTDGYADVFGYAADRVGTVS